MRHLLHGSRVVATIQGAKEGWGKPGLNSEPKKGTIVGCELDRVLILLDDGNLIFIRNGTLETAGGRRRVSVELDVDANARIRRELLHNADNHPWTKGAARLEKPEMTVSGCLAWAKSLSQEDLKKVAAGLRKLKWERMSQWDKARSLFNPLHFVEGE